jgi:hypothetical protein
MLNENNEVVFAYQVNTIMPITGLSCGNLMVPSTAKLTKEDVLVCLKKAPVFRRFGSSKLERVTISNLDRLHNEKFMTETEYEEFLDKQGDNRGKVVEAPVVEEKKETEPVVKEEAVVEEEPTPVVEEEVKEETVTDEPVVEEAETVEETAQTEDTVEEEVTENVNDVEVSEDVTDTPVEEETKDQEENKNSHNNRYNNKKKHNR